MYSNNQLEVEIEWIIQLPIQKVQGAETTFILDAVEDMDNPTIVTSISQKYLGNPFTHRIVLDFKSTTPT